MQDNAISNTVKQIENRLFDNINVEELAKSAFFSKYYFQRLFHEVVGNSVMEYVKKRRLSLAAKELCETDTAIIEIALKYGYNSHEGFTRAFKAYHNITPTECRKYSVYRMFVAKIVKMEGFNMVGASQEVLRYSDEMLSNLNIIVIKAKKTAEEMSGSASEFNLQSFIVIANEMRLLAERTQRASKIAQELYAGLNASDFSAINCGYEIIKILDDTNFQLSIIDINSRLEAGRADARLRDKAKMIAKSCSLLSENARDKSKEAIEFINKLAQLTYEEIENTIKGYFAEFEKDINEALKEVGQANELISGVVNNDGIYEYAVISEEIGVIYNEMSGFAKVFAAMKGKDSSVEDISLECHSLIGRVDELSTRLNILIFAAKLNGAAVSNNHSAEVLKCMEELIGGLHDTIQVCTSDISSADDLAVLTKSRKSEVEIESISKLKFIENIQYQLSLLYFYTKSEFIKSERYLSSNAVDEFKRIIFSIQAVTSQVNQAQYSDGVESIIGGMCEKVSDIAKALKNVADNIGDNGGAVLALSEEYERLGRLDVSR